MKVIVDLLAVGNQLDLPNALSDVWRHPNEQIFKRSVRKFRGLWAGYFVGLWRPAFCPSVAECQRLARAPLLLRRLTHRTGLRGLHTSEKIAQTAQVFFRHHKVVCTAAEWFGDILLAVWSEKYGDELHVLAALVVEGLGDHVSFIVAALSHSRLFVAAKAPVIGLGADSQNEGSILKLVQHPTGPSLSRGAVDVLVEGGLESLLAQPLGKT